jgi:hypothetical protein
MRSAEGFGVRNIADLPRSGKKAGHQLLTAPHVSCSLPSRLPHMNTWDTYPFSGFTASERKAFLF